MKNKDRTSVFWQVHLPLFLHFLFVVHYPPSLPLSIFAMHIYGYHVCFILLFVDEQSWGLW